MLNIHLVNYHPKCKNLGGNNANKANTSSYQANMRCLDNAHGNIFKNVLLVLFALLAMQVTQLALAYRALLPIPVEFSVNQSPFSPSFATQNISQKKVALIDHNRWQQLLKRYLVSDHDLESNAGETRRFDYASVTNKDKDELQKYIHELEGVNITHYSRHEQLAFWVNLYNALTVQLIIQHYPVESIKDIGHAITGPWNDVITNVAGTPLTLNQIEHGIIRANWQDNRVHYVLNCASIGCPDLSDRPLLADSLDEQLNQAARSFINQTKAVHFTKNKLILSKIYQWFSDDFGDNRQEIIAHLSHYAKPQLQQQLLRFSGEISYQYNWQLNHPQSTGGDFNE